MFCDLIQYRALEWTGYAGPGQACKIVKSAVVPSAYALYWKLSKGSNTEILHKFGYCKHLSKD